LQIHHEALPVLLKPYTLVQNTPQSERKKKEKLEQEGLFSPTSPYLFASHKRLAVSQSELQIASR